VSRQTCVFSFVILIVCHCLAFLDQELISYRYSSCCCCCRCCCCSSSSWCVSNWIGIKYGRNVLNISIDWQSPIFYLTSHFQDGDHDVISHSQVLPPGEWTWNICLYSSICQFLIYSTLLVDIWIIPVPVSASLPRPCHMTARQRLWWERSGTSCRSLYYGMNENLRHRSTLQALYPL